MHNHTLMIAGFTLRAWHPEDAAAIAALRNMPGVRHGTMATPYTSIATVAANLTKLGPNDHSIVAETAGRVIAMASLHRTAGRRSHSAGLGMMVADDWHGRGVGTALLGTLTDLADNALALSRIELHVFADNAPAIALYQKFHFTVEGHHCAYALRDGLLIDALSMARIVA